MAMGGAFPFQWPADPGFDAVALLPPLPAAVPADAGVAYYADAAADMHAVAMPDFAAALAAIRREEEEAAGIRLVHLLMSCAGSVEAGDHAGAAAHLADAHAALAAVSPGSGIGRVAVHFTAALSRRLFPPTPSPPPPASTDAAAEHAFLYHRFYEAGPYLKFAHFTANQAILEAVQGCKHVHIIDFSLMQGLQWPALIQALALRPGGPPSLRLTGIGPPSPPGRDDLRDVGVRLADLARSVRVHFSFRGVAANRLDEVRPWMLQVSQGEAVAVSSVLQLHRLLADPSESDASVSRTGAAPAIDSVLDCVSSLRPRVVAVVEQEADHNKPGFLDRFTEALFYYSAVFDSLDAASGGAGTRRPRRTWRGRSATSCAGRARSGGSGTSRCGGGGTGWAARGSPPCRWAPTRCGRRGCWWGSSPGRDTASRRPTGASRWGGTAGRSSRRPRGVPRRTTTTITATTATRRTAAAAAAVRRAISAAAAS